MNNKNIIIIVITIIIFTGIALFIKNNNERIEANSDSAITSQGNEVQSADKVEVYMFHTTQRCSTCATIGRLANEAINEYFQTEVDSGKIEFREINIDLPENKALADKFQASGSSLYINSIINGEDNISQDMTVWRLAGDEIKFKLYLKDKINNNLNK